MYIFPFPAFSHIRNSDTKLGTYVQVITGQHYTHSRCDSVREASVLTNHIRAKLVHICTVYDFQLTCSTMNVLPGLAWWIVYRNFVKVMVQLFYRCIQYNHNYVWTCKMCICVHVLRKGKASACFRVHWHITSPTQQVLIELFYWQTISVEGRAMHMSNFD
jgi:hypothetical protein